MFSFFTFLVGGLYYGGRYMHELSANSEYERESKARIRCLRDFEDMYGTPYSMRGEIEDYILNDQHYEDICNKFEREFKYVLGENWRNELLIPPLGYGGIDRPTSDSHVYYVYHMMLASEGKVDSFKSTEGIKIHMPKKEESLRFCKCIECLLQKNANGQPLIRLIYTEGKYGIGYMKYSPILKYSSNF